MANVFSGSAGPVGSNVSDYTSLPNTIGIGPVASGEAYANMLQPQPSTFNQLGTALAGYGQVNKAMQGLMPQPQVQPLQFQQMRAPVQLQQVDLMTLLRNMGGA